MTNLEFAVVIFFGSWFVGLVIVALWELKDRSRR